MREIPDCAPKEDRNATWIRIQIGQVIGVVALNACYAKIRKPRRKSFGGFGQRIFADVQCRVMEVPLLRQESIDEMMCLSSRACP